MIAVIAIKARLYHKAVQMKKKNYTLCQLHCASAIYAKFISCTFSGSRNVNIFLKVLIRLVYTENVCFLRPCLTFFHPNSCESQCHLIQDSYYLEW